MFSSRKIREKRNNQIVEKIDDDETADDAKK